MTDREFGELMATIDNLWGGLDDGLEAGYAWLLDIPEEDYELCLSVVRQLADGVDRAPNDLPFVPKAPEFKRRLDKVKRQIANQRRMSARLRRLMGAGDQPQLPQETTR
jgi:hypothetical protein